MPFYDFQCKKCEHIWEDLVYSTDPNPPCPECACEDVGKLPSLVAPGVVKLSGKEYKAKVMDDAKKDRQTMYKDETKLANVVGEGKYNNKLAARKDASYTLNQLKTKGKKSG